MGIRALLRGMALGAGAMYLFDPIQGRRRRARIRDQFYSVVNSGGDFLEKACRDAEHRIHGTVAELTSAVQGDHADDEVLVERVRSKIGRFVSNPRAIDVSAENGRIILSGPVFADELPGLISAVWRVKGVKDVENRVEAHEEAENFPGLQGRSRPHGDQLDFLQTNWAPATRLFLGAVGCGLMANCLARRSVGAMMLGTVGFGLTMRSITNTSIGEMIDQAGEMLAPRAEMASALNGGRFQGGRRKAHSGGGNHHGDHPGFESSPAAYQG
jgi:hypothetical protein